MVVVYLHGQMAEDIKEIIKMIKKMDIEFLNGLMEKNIKDIGKMENKMGKENFIMIKQRHGESVLFKMEEELNGLMNKDYLSIILFKKFKQFFNYFS